jgi:hypothetical protein
MAGSHYSSSDDAGSHSSFDDDAGSHSSFDDDVGAGITPMNLLPLFNQVATTGTPMDEDDDSIDLPLFNQVATTGTPMDEDDDSIDDGDLSHRFASLNIVLPFAVGAVPVGPGEGILAPLPAMAVGAAPAGPGEGILAPLPAMAVGAAPAGPGESINDNENPGAPGGFPSHFAATGEDPAAVGAGSIEIDDEEPSAFATGVTSIVTDSTGYDSEGEGGENVSTCAIIFFEAACPPHHADPSEGHEQGHGL